MKFILEISKNQLKEDEKQNKLIIDQTKKVVNDFRVDYQKLLEVLREKEGEIKQYEKEMSKKSEQIYFQEEKLLSLYVLEHKLQMIGITNQRDMQKLKNDYENRIKDASDNYKQNPNLVLINKEYDKKFKELQKELNSKDANKTRNRNVLEFTVLSLKSQLEEQSKSFINKEKEVLDLKEKLVDTNKSVQQLLNTTER